MLKDLLLPLDLQFFAEGEGGGDNGGVDNAGQTSDGKDKTDNKDQQKEHMIPKSRFDEVNNAYKEIKKQLDEMKQASQTKEREEAEKRGEFEGLYKKAQNDLEVVKGENKAAKERVEVLEGVINKLLEQKLESIDKDYHDLIPDGMTPEQKLAWVSNAEAKGIFGNKSVNEPLGEQTNPKGNQEVDINKLNPLQMLMAGYSQKNK